MTIKISQLGTIGAVQGNILIPIVGNVGGTLTTLQANITQLQSYIISTGLGNIAIADNGISSTNNGNIKLTANTYSWTFDQTIGTINLASGGLKFADGSQQTIAFNNTAPIITTLIANAATQSDLIIGINANVAAANVGMLGYVNSQLTAANTSANTANIAMVGYVNSQVTAANVAWTANAYQQQALIGNLIVSGYSNVNATAFLSTYTGLVQASNVFVSGNIIASSYNGPVNASSLYASGAYIGLLGVTSTQATISSTTGAFTVAGGVGIAGSMYIGGNLTVLGVTTTVGTQSLAVANAFVFLANNNISNATDFGIVGQYSLGQGVVYGGLVYHAADQIYRLFSNLTPQPSTTINMANVVYPAIQMGNIIAANIIGTSITPSQPYITTVGNLGNVNSSGNISTTQYFVGNGYFLTGVTTSYSNSNVASYLPTYSGNVGSLTVIGNLFVTGNTTITNYEIVNSTEIVSGNIISNSTVTAAFFAGNGYQLTGILGAINNSIYNGNTQIGNSTTLVDYVSSTGNTAVRWEIASIDNVNNNYRSSTIHTLNANGAAYYTEFAVVTSNATSNVATFTSNIANGNINLYANGNSSNVSVTFRRTISGSTTAPGYLVAGPQGPAGTSYSNVQVATYLPTYTGNVLATYVRTTPQTVTNLVSASTAGAGARAFVTDANTSTFNSVVTGSFGNSVPVFSDGTSWRVG